MDKDTCTGLKKLREQELEEMETEKENKAFQPTWIIKADCNYGKVVFHTIGLKEYNSMELELNLSINGKRATQFLNIIAYEIAHGKSFKDGDIDETIFTCPIAFKEVNMIYGDGEKGLRVIFQDRNFKFPWEDGCETFYKRQI